MPYEAITDEAEIADAFKRIRDTFQQGEEQVGTFYRCPKYLHRNHGLVGAFGVRDEKYLAMFGRERQRSPMFEANVPMRGFRPRIGKGLFVRDAQGRRFLAHLGRFSHRSNNEKKERLRAQANFWVEVTNVGTLALITPIDEVSTNDLADHIDRFTKILEGKSALNTILYGPPGTGKTFATFRRCVEICDGKESCPDNNDEVRDRYRKLVGQGRVEFVTFHQSYGYEEFVEGLRPATDSVEKGEETKAGFRLVATPGVLKRIAERARSLSGSTGKSFDLSTRQVFKIHLGNSRNEYQNIFDECIKNRYVLLNYGRDMDWSDERFSNIDEIRRELREENSAIQFINHFRNNMKTGDLVIVPAKDKRFRAIGEVISPYEFVRREDGKFNHRRRVRWLWKNSQGCSVSEIHQKELRRHAIDHLRQENIKHDELRRYIEQAADTKPHVLVIDEINRANVSKVMGELITLLEEDKREGAANEVAVTLPHSRERFTLPANLHILGTMNTADRSIALLDTALRRRFEFEELAPNPDLLNGAAEATGIALPAVLRAINERLEYLVDRDHLIGHAWLMDAHTKADVDRIMRHKIIPLIAEYFYDDWQKIRAVLGGTDDFVQGEPIERPPGLNDMEEGETRLHWTIREEFTEDAYRSIVSPDQSQTQAQDPAQATGVQPEAD